MSEPLSVIRERPLLLAIDTAADQAGLALFDGERIAELSWPAARAQTTSLLTAIDDLRSLLSADLSQIAVVAVASGPGSFSGLRVGLGAAKGLALGLDCAIIGVPTLAAAVLPYQALGLTTLGVVPAGRQRVVWALATPDSALSAPVNSTVTEMLATVTTPGPIMLAGELDPTQRALVAGDGRIMLPPPGLRQRRPAAIATLGWNRWQRGETDDLRALAPTYAGRADASGRDV